MPTRPRSAWLLPRPPAHIPLPLSLRPLRPSVVGPPAVLSRIQGCPRSSTVTSGAALSCCPRSAPAGSGGGRSPMSRVRTRSCPSLPLRGHSVGCHADNATGERARNIRVPRTWQAIVGRPIVVGRILWTGKQPLNGGCWRRPESRRLRDDRMKSTVSNLALV